MDRRCATWWPHPSPNRYRGPQVARRSEEHTSEPQSRQYLVCRLLLEKKNRLRKNTTPRVSSPHTLHPGICSQCGGSRSTPQRTRYLTRRLLLAASFVGVFFFIERAPPEITALPHPPPLLV